jgi:hypothetical protein
MEHIYLVPPSKILDRVRDIHHIHPIGYRRPALYNVLVF